MSRRLSVGLAGVGRMGEPIARRLAAAGFPVSFYDIRPDAGAALVAAGLQRVPSAGGLGDADVSLSLLPDATATTALLCGHDGIARRAKPLHVHVILGTVGPVAVRAAAAAAAPVAVVDAPVSGSVDHAADGRLTAIIGADAGDLQTIEPVLEAFTSHRFLVGPVGAGAVVKLAVNALVHDTNVAIAEALLLAEANGVDPDAVYDVLEASVVSSPYLRYKRRHMLDPTLPAAGPIRMAEKDVDLALDLARAAGLHLPELAAARAVLREAGDAGWRDADVGAVFAHLRSRRVAG